MCASAPLGRHACQLLFGRQPLPLQVLVHGLLLAGQDAGVVSHGLLPVAEDRPAAGSVRLYPAVVLGHVSAAANHSVDGSRRRHVAGTVTQQNKTSVMVNFI